MSKTAKAFSLLDYRADPYAYYAELREQAPVHYFEPGFWAISRHRNVVAALKRPDLFSSHTGIWQSTPVGEDAPLHTRLRKAASGILSRQRILSLQGRMQEITKEILDRVQREDHFELIGTLATELPFIVIWELLGIPQDIQDECFRWLTQNMPSPLLENRLCELPLFDGYDLSVEQKIRLVRFLLLAATDTTRSLIGNAVLALLRNPDQMDLVRQNRKLLPSVVEESLRYEAPAPLGERRATQDVTVDGITIPAGSFVFLLLASANRDPEAFPEPDRFIVTRDASKHVSFGEGPHYCLGAQLARLEAQVALEGLLFQLKGLQALHPLDHVEYIESSKLRGLTALHLTFEKNS